MAKPSIPKGTCGKNTLRILFMVGFQCVTKILLSPVSRFSVIIWSFLGCFTVYFGAFGYIFQQIFSK